MCSIVAIIGNSDSVRLGNIGNVAQKHRGLSSNGIAAYTKQGIRTHKRKGHAKLEELDIIAEIVLGQNRYPTSGSADLPNWQPAVVALQRLEVKANGFFESSLYKGNEIAMAHNGNFSDLEGTTSSISDTYHVLGMLRDSRASSLLDRVLNILPDLKGSYSMSLMGDVGQGREVIAVRDPHGNRPLWLGFAPGGGHIVASENTAIEDMGGIVSRKMEPGEVLDFSNGTLKRYNLGRTRLQLCSVEAPYLQREDSIAHGMEDDNITAADFRYNLGVMMAQNDKKKYDAIIGLPKSGNWVGQGYADIKQMPLSKAITLRDPDVRSFILPNQNDRNQAIEDKLEFHPELIKGKRILLADDSVIRGTNTKYVVSRLYELGAKSVDIISAIPMYKNVCHYGVDIGKIDELVAYEKNGNLRTPRQIAQFIGADSIRFPTLNEYKNMFPKKGEDYCFACFKEQEKK